MNEVAITAKSMSIVRVAGHLAVKRRNCERMRVHFAVMKGEHAAIGGHKTAKRLPVAAMRVHHAALGTSNAGM